MQPSQEGLIACSIDDDCKRSELICHEVSSGAGEIRAIFFCALPLASVIETLRSPPVTAIGGAPEWVQGVAVIRGATVVIVDLGILLGIEVRQT